MLLEILKKNLHEVQQELEPLYEERRNASVDARGGYDNRINQLTREFEKLTEEIKEEEAKIKTPDQIQIFCYVVASTKEKVRDNLSSLDSDICACLFEDDDRYHETDCSKWRPFKAEGYISEVLEEIQEQYPFEAHYLDGDLEQEYWLLIDQYLNDTIAIVDLLSIDSKNKDIAVRFDKPKVQIVMPLCRQLPNIVCDFAQKKEKEVFKTADAYAEKLNFSDFYFSDLSFLSNFKRKLKSIFRAKFPIKNQSTVESPVRNLSMNLT